MIFLPIITVSDCFWAVMWGWYYSAFAFFFTIVFSIIIMRKKSISSLIMLAHCYWIMFFLYGIMFLCFFGYTYSNNICCYTLSYNLMTSSFIAVLLFFIQIGIVFYIRSFYRANIYLVSKTVALSGFCATFFVYCIAKTFII
jgi:hypothetical protein